MAESDIRLHTQENGKVTVECQRCRTHSTFTSLNAAAAHGRAHVNAGCKDNR